MNGSSYLGGVVEGMNAREMWTTFLVSVLEDESYARVAPKAQQIFDRVIAPRYAEPHRHYHTLEHVVSCVWTLAEVMEDEDADDPADLALWFHDIVYLPFAKDNEERSADVLREVGQELYLSSTLVDHAADIIVCTKHAVSVEHMSRSHRYAIDADLSILGEDEKVFDKYEADVRLEYAAVPEDIFRAARVKILEGFLRRPFIYNTPEFSSRFEPQARINLERSITKLRNV